MLHHQASLFQEKLFVIDQNYGAIINQHVKNFGKWKLSDTTEYLK